MANSWFKFYGQDWLTDPKVISLSHTDRLCFITLLCLASASRHDDYKITGINELTLFSLAHLSWNPYESDGWGGATGVLQRLNDNAMITLGDNGDIVIKRFKDRQESNLTGYERIKRYREKAKQSKKANDNTNDNAMITLDKIREEKIIQEKTGDKIAQQQAVANKNPMSYEHLNDGEVQYTEENPKKKKSKYGNRGQFIGGLTGWYCRLKGEVAAGAYLKDMAALVDIVDKQYPNYTKDKVALEIKSRITVYKLYQEAKHLSWSISGVLKNWNAINDVYAAKTNFTHDDIMP